MKMRFLGNTGIKVSELCFGTMTFGGRGRHKIIGEVNQKEADILVGMALDAGINFFDTADVYSEGLSEEICGRALGIQRKNVILATKVRARMGPGPNEVGLSRHHILEGCAASLKRLGTDYIDLFQVHSFDPITPMEETIGALDDLVRAGKVRYIGCSNFAGWQLMKALSVSEKHGWEKYVSLQALYSLLSRELENELVPLCLDQGIGILIYSPLGGGFLTGKFRKEQPIPKDTRLGESMDNLPFKEEKGFEIIENLDTISKDHESTVAQAALNYLLRKQGVTSVIIGARTPEQLADNLRTTDWEMTPTEVKQLDELTQPVSIYPYSFLAQNIHGR
ncbi:aldo/keto reductase [Chloroflexota bacterium]